MANNHNQDTLDYGDPDDLNSFVKECFKRGLFIWHTWDIDTGSFTPTYQIEKAVAFCNDELRLTGATTVSYNYSEAQNHMHYFNSAFSIVGAIMPDLRTPIIVVPNEVKKNVVDFIETYNLADYRDLVWHLLFRLQIMYTQRIHYDVVNPDYAKQIRDIRQSNELLIQLIEYYILPHAASPIKSVSLTLQYEDGTKTLNDKHLVWDKVDDIMIAWLNSRYKEGLPIDWRDKIRNFDASHILKHDFEYLHRRFSNSFIAFLRGTGVATAESNLSYQYLKPIASLFNLSEYPFNKTELDVKNIQSILKNQE